MRFVAQNLFKHPAKGLGQTLILGFLPILFLIPSPKASQGQEIPLLRFHPSLPTDLFLPQDAQIQWVHRGKSYVLRVQTGHTHPWPGVTIRAPQGQWDLSKQTELVVKLRNIGNSPIQIHCRVDNPGADGRKNCITKWIWIGPGQSGTLVVPLRRRLPQWLVPRLYGMRGYPGGMDPNGLVASNITQVILFLNHPKQNHAFEILRLSARGHYQRPKWLDLGPDRFFPFIDRYGQFIHKEWPRKTHSDADLRQRRQEETQDLAAHPGPKDWDRFGGWTSGPQLRSTGFFRVQKYHGQWWLVDPEGRLFWSHGIDCVHWRNATTPITDREFYFAELPPRSSPLGVFYQTSNWAPLGYYKGRRYETFNFTGANLYRKYGPDWLSIFRELCHRRLRSWGLNTIGNWSDASIYLIDRTPYVVAIHAVGRPIEGSSGYWGKFPDPFDPGFIQALRKRMAAERDRSAGDPWCIGYFVHNELSWGDELSLAEAALRSPADQPAKQQFVQFLRQKYSNIQALNRVWGTHYADWQALLHSTTPPDRNRAREDLAAFYTQIAETYFRICRQVVKEVAPHQLYLGCRFSQSNERAIRAAAKYCDIISFNRYRRSVANLRLPEGVDKPVIIGEFHFGALDRGLFSPGLVPVANQQQRAQAYIRYVRGALQNPWIVGVHWFQYGDQATTGRGDGENYQIGFLDVCDTPYIETIQACRQIGYRLYTERIRSAQNSLRSSKASPSSRQ